MLQDSHNPNAGAYADRWSAALEAAGVVGWEWRPNSKEMHWSPEAAAVLGITARTSAGEDFFELIHRQDRNRVEQALARAAVERVGFEERFHLTRPDGQARRVLIRGEGNPRAAAVRGVLMIDSTPDGPMPAWKLAEAIIESSRDAIVSKTLDGVITSWNRGAERIFGYSAEEAVGKSILLIIPKEREDEEREILGRLRRGERIEHFETQRVCKDGRRLDISLTVSPVCDAAGRIVGASKVARDISEQKRAVRRLRESEERFRRLADSAPVLIWMSDASKGGVYFNAPWLEYVGEPVESQLGEGWLEAVHDDDRAAMLQECDAAFHERRDFTTEFRLRRADGRYRWMLDSGAPRFAADGQFLGFIGTCVDVTRQKEAEEAARRSQQMLEAVIEASPVAIAVLDRDGIVHLWNSAAAEMFGWSREEIMGRPAPMAVPENREEFLENLRLTMAGQPLVGREVVRRKRDGTPIEVAVWSSVLHDRWGAPDRVVALIADVSERKRAEQALRESEENFRALADNIAQFAWMADSSGWIFWYNQRWFEYTGATLEEMRGWGWRKVQHPDHAERVVDNFRRRVEAGQVWEDTFPLRRKDGQYRWFLSRAIPICNEAGQVLRWFGTNTDITDQRNVEDALRRREIQLRELNATLEERVAQRTAQLGRQSAQLRLLANELTEAEQRERKHLAQALHDGLQQMLVAAKMRVNMVGVHLQQPELREEWREIDDLLDTTIEASRSLAIDLSPPILHDAGLSRSLDWLKRWFASTHNFEVRLEIADEPPPLAENIKLFLFQSTRELLFNVVKHAEVSTARVLLEVADNEVRVHVEDAGQGFDVKRLDEDVLHPRGFGLLSIRERAEALGGSLEIESGPGAGARFTLSTPVVRREEAMEPAGPASSDENQPEPAPDDSPRVRILVADDHKIVRQGLVTMLQERPDFEVVGEAANGTEAVELAEKLRPAVVVMDVTMPRLSGLDATRLIKQRYPRMHIIGLSLHHEEDMAEAMQAAGAAAYLRKDGPAEQLFTTVRELCRASDVG